ncbi:MAG: helix-turn-helix domain-containing protein [Saprospiraceae bacterium]|nr:helix-turn-helix domain-containing protein [Saprospiraceae bacterium]
MNNLTTFEGHLDKHRGKIGRQEELADKTGTKKSYISRIESGKSDIQLSTFYRIIEMGLGRTLNIAIG